MRKLFVWLLAAGLLSACATSPTGRSQFMLISPESAIVESEKAYINTVKQLDSQDKLADDPLLADRVARITGRLVSVAVAEYPRTADWQWSVAIIDDPKTINAWCMAGGRMAVYTGLFEKLDLTDDEFAHIMGHEIAHALANHTAERMSRAMATNIGIVSVAILTDSNLAGLGAAAAATLALELPNSRTAESEADELGMQLAVRAGYSPDAAVTLWQKMGAEGGDGPPQFLSTHPAPGNREAALAEMAPRARQLNPTGTRAAVHPVRIETGDTAG
ncbi:MAG: M48 family metallopeptidase [Halioglobus sp.]|nr:M48 family metallopeptidase [Halioglobus sp.]